jgi:DNA-binding CsgD family transcriptional regulator
MFRFPFSDKARAPEAVLLDDRRETEVASLKSLMARLLLGTRAHGFSAMVLLSPDPTCDGGAIGRVMVAASTDRLKSVAGLLETGLATNHKQVVCAVELDRGGGCCPSLAQHGYKHALVMKIPVLGVHCHEFILLSTAAHVSDDSLAKVHWGVMSDWPHWRSAISRMCPLSPRERECLADAAAGKTAIESATHLQCTERTIRCHLDSARKKLKASSTAEAIHRAHLMCIF